jgi:hypothetical protein
MFNSISLSLNKYLVLQIKLIIIKNRSNDCITDKTYPATKKSTECKFKPPKCQFYVKKTKKQATILFITS